MRGWTPAWTLPLVLFLGIEAVYLANGRTLGNLDTVPARYLPFSLVRYGDFDFNEFPFLFRGGLVPTPFREHDGRFLSIFSPVAGLLATPFYLIPVLRGLDPQSPRVAELEKLAASTITALSAVVLFLLLRRLGGASAATGLTLVYAFGTSAFSISSQALWQHGPSQLLLAAGLYLLVRGTRPPRLLGYAGLPLGAAVVARYTNALFLLPVLWYVAWHHRRQLARCLLLAALPVLALLAYNTWLFGSPSEISYGRGFLSPGSGRWSASMHSSLPGLLVSPISGLFVYSPIFVFSLVGMVRCWRSADAALWRSLALGSLLVVLLTSKFFLWWSYWFYGPRLLADLAPVLVLFLWPAWQAIEGRRLVQSVFVAAAVVSVLMHGIGAFGYDGSWYAKPVPMEEDRIWSWRDPPFVHYGATLVRHAAGAIGSGPQGTPAHLPQAEEGATALAGGATGACRFDAVLERALTPLPDPPRLEIRSGSSADRSTRVRSFFVVLVNGRTARNLALYLALRQPDGRLYFVFPDTTTAPDPPCALWLGLGTPVMLPPEFRVDDDFWLGLLRAGRPPGRYAWHVFLTEPNSTRVVARASHAFDLGPE